jgi:uncharacterized repeat protein (TIGR03803 family)
MNRTGRSFHGLLLIGVLTLFAHVRANAQLYEVVHRFTGESGLHPVAPLVQGRDGYLYGSTLTGGPDNGGHLFRFSTNGVFTNLAFAGQTSGRYPEGGLVEGLDGNFYGTMSAGTGMVRGTVFRMTPGGTVTTLAIFYGTNGANPKAGMVLGPDGAFYGSTHQGGTNYPVTGGGTIFRITTNGTLTTLASLDNTNGAGITAPPVFGPDGMLYGTAVNGGRFNAGTFFRLRMDGANFTHLASFDGTNGAFPHGQLLLGRDNAFYGTTESSGPSNPTPGVGYGTVFRATMNGQITTIASFNFTNGANPMAGLIEGKDGALYGVTMNGGAGPFNYDGTIFRVTTNGTLTAIVSFGFLESASAMANLIRTSDGSFYGTSYYGAGFDGTIFRLSTLALSISRSSSRSVISWPTNGTGCRVQFTTNLTAPWQWQDATGAIYESGNRLTFTNDTSASVQFYRLIKP